MMLHRHFEAKREKAKTAEEPKPAPKAQESKPRKGRKKTSSVS